MTVTLRCKHSNGVILKPINIVHCTPLAKDVDFFDSDYRCGSTASWQCTLCGSICFGDMLRSATLTLLYEDGETEEQFVWACLMCRAQLLKLATSEEVRRTLCDCADLGRTTELTRSVLKTIEVLPKEQQQSIVDNEAAVARLWHDNNVKQEELST